MPRAVHLDPVMLRRYIDADMTLSEMARLFGVTDITVRRKIDQAGLRAAFLTAKARRGGLHMGRPAADEPGRGSGSNPAPDPAPASKPKPDPKPAPAFAPEPACRTGAPPVRASARPAPPPGPLAAPFWTPERDAAVLRTKGRYQDINHLAERLGITSQRIVARWHQLRIAA